MTWADMIPSVKTALAIVLSAALGVGGTVGVQAVKTADPPKPPTKIDVACVAPAEVGKMNDRMAGVETSSTLALEEIRLMRVDQERRNRLRAVREAAKKTEPEGYKIFGVLIK